MITSLRTKALLVTAAVLLLCFLAIYVVSRTILERGYLNLEQQAVQDQLYRGEMALHDQLGFLANTTRDYAHWDDTYAFVRSGDEDYATANLQPYFFESFQIDMVLFLDNGHEVVYQRAYHSQEAAEADIADDVLNLIFETDALFEHENNRDVLFGLLSTPEGIMGVASVPVMRSNLRGARAGYIIFGRYFEDGEIVALIESVGHDLELYDLTSAELPANVAAAQSSMLGSGSTFVVSVRDDLAYGYHFLNDVNGEPVFILCVNMARNIYMEGMATQNYFLTAILIVGIVFCVFTLILLDGLVLSRIATLGRQVRDISPDQRNRTVAFDGNDEVAQLAQQINLLLRDIDRYDETLAALNEELEKKNVALRAEQEHKDRFFSHLSHELRTPLSNIKLRLYLIKKQPERATDGIAAITQLVDQITQLIGDMVEMSHIQRGVTPIEHLQVDLYPLVRAAVKSLEPRLQRRELQISITCDSVATKIDGDAERLNIAISNITRFCIQSAEPNTEIRIQLSSRIVENVTWAIISISCETNAFKVVDLYDLLMPFFVPTEADKTGTRLHLSLAKSIIEMHMGRIRLETDDEDRKKFIVALPQLSKATSGVDVANLQRQRMSIGDPI